MSPVTAPPLQTVVFADLDAGIWGVAWGSPNGSLGLGPLRAGSALAGTGVAFNGTADDVDWALAGDAGELTISPVTDAVSSEQLDGFEQLCEVQGKLGTADDQALRAIGVRAVRAGIDPAKVQSLRDASVWFAPDDGLVLTALRPSGSRGHDHDVIVGAVFEPDAAKSVADPRLSTTYSADGAPTRAGLEFWIAAEGDAAEYPRRAAGEAIGAQITLSADGFDLCAHAMRWQSRGRDGIGAYVLAQSR
jgi:hypothetical protein